MFSVVLFFIGLAPNQYQCAFRVREKDDQSSQLLWLTSGHQKIVRDVGHDDASMRRVQDRGKSAFKTSETHSFNDEKCVTTSPWTRFLCFLL